MNDHCKELCHFLLAPLLELIHSRLNYFCYYYKVHNCFSLWEENIIIDNIVFFVLGSLEKKEML